MPVFTHGLQLGAILQGTIFRDIFGCHAWENMLTSSGSAQCAELPPTTKNYTAQMSIILSWGIMVHATSIILPYYLSLIAGTVSHLTLLFFFKNVLIIFGPLHFRINFRISLSCVMENFICWLEFRCNYISSWWKLTFYDIESSYSLTWYLYQFSSLMPFNKTL